MGSVGLRPVSELLGVLRRYPSVNHRRLRPPWLPSFSL